MYSCENGNDSDERGREEVSKVTLPTGSARFWIEISEVGVRQRSRDIQGTRRHDRSIRYVPERGDAQEVLMHL